MKLTRTKVTELEVSEDEFNELFRQWVENQCGVDLGKLNIQLDEFSETTEFSGFDYFGRAVKVPGRTKTTFQIIGFKA